MSPPLNTILWALNDDDKKEVNVLVAPKSCSPPQRNKRRREKKNGRTSRKSDNEMSAISKHGALQWLRSKSEKKSNDKNEKKNSR